MRSEYLWSFPGREPPEKGIDIRDAVKLMRGGRGPRSDEHADAPRDGAKASSSVRSSPRNTTQGSRPVAACTSRAIHPTASPL